MRWVPRSPLWYACSAPERPTDPYVVWHYSDCRGCALKAEMVSRLYPDDSLVQRFAAGFVA